MPQPIEYESTTFDAKQAVLVPVILLYVAAGLGVLTSLATLTMGGFFFFAHPASLGVPPPLTPTVIAVWLGFFSLLNLGLYGLVAFSARRLQQLRSYPMVMTAAIITVVPLCSCVTAGGFSIPVVLVSLVAGVWTLVVIMKPEIKAAFV